MLVTSIMRSPKYLTLSSLHKDLLRTSRFLGLLADLRSVTDALPQLGHDRRVAQGRDIAQGAPIGDVAQQPAHDLARARLGQIAGPDDPARARELADALGDGFTDPLDRLLVPGEIALQRDERHDRLAGVLVVLADHRGLRRARALHAPR